MSDRRNDYDDYERDNFNRESRRSDERYSPRGDDTREENRQYNDEPVRRPYSASYGERPQYGARVAPPTTPPQFPETPSPRYTDAVGYAARRSAPYGANIPSDVRDEPDDDFGYDFDANGQPNGYAVPNMPPKKKGFLSSIMGKKDVPRAASGDMQNVIITYPQTYTDVQAVIDSLRSRQALIVDLTKINEKSVQRILDFLSGAIYALGGNQQRIGDNMFLFTPDGVNIQGPTELKRKYDR